MERAWERLFSNRGRWWKAAAALALAALLAVGFARNPLTYGETFLSLMHQEAPAVPRSLRVGPENLRLESVEASLLRVEKYGRRLELVLPEGPAAERAREAAAAARRGDFLSVTAYHLGGPRFEVATLVLNRSRKAKLLVSGVAAVLVVLLLPCYFRWSGGALRARGGEE